MAEELEFRVSDISDLSTAEEEAFTKFKHLYMRQNPPPQKPGRVNAANVGLQFWLYLSASLSAVTLASMRTADLFYQAASLGSIPELKYVEAIMSVFAIEGGLVVYSAAKAIRSKKLSTGWLNVAIIFMVLVSTVGGLGQSIRLIDNINPQVLKWFQYALALMIGAGTSLISFVGGEVLGQQLVIVTDGYEQKIAEYNGIVAAYFADMRAAFQRSDQHKLARGSMKSSVYRTGSSGGDSGMVRLRQNEQQPIIFSNPPPIRVGVKNEQIRDYLDGAFGKDRRLASVKEITATIGCAKSTASEQRSKWMVDNAAQIALLERADSSGGDE